MGCCHSSSDIKQGMAASEVFARIGSCMATQTLHRETYCCTSAKQQLSNADLIITMVCVDMYWPSPCKQPLDQAGVEDWHWQPLSQQGIPDGKSATTSDTSPADSQALARKLWTLRSDLEIKLASCCSAAGPLQCN